MGRESRAIRATADAPARLACAHSNRSDARVRAHESGFSQAGCVVEIAPINAQIAQAVERMKSAVPSSKAAGGVSSAPDFVASLDSALAAVSKNQNASSELQRQFQLENPAVSLEETMIAMNKSSLSFSAAVQVRNRLVAAYEQIMQMPV